MRKGMAIGIDDPPADTRSALATATQVGTGRKRHIPGEPGLWILIFGDLLAFAGFFCAFVIDRAHQLGVYERSREDLTLAFGAVNTLLLLTGSLFVVLGMRAVRERGVGSLAPRWFAAAAACGAVFAIDKFIEWGTKLADGHPPSENGFFAWFFFMTGVHFGHLVVGMGLLAWMWAISRRSEIGAREIRILECGATYWHLVDLLWIALFALLYCMRGAG